MRRLVAVGFPYVMLDKQWGMNPDIASFVSLFFYDGKLLSAPGLDMRKGTKPFRQAAAALCHGRYSNALWVNIKTVPKAEEKVRSKFTVRVGPTGSKSCEFSALHTVKIAVRFISTLRIGNPTGRVAILT